MRRLFFILTLLISTLALGQNPGARVDDIALTVRSPGLPSPAEIIPNPQIQVCTEGAIITGSNCSPSATTYTDATLTTACSNLAQVVMPGTNVCTATGDNSGNFGFWVASGTYVYCVNSPFVTGRCLTKSVHGDSLNIPLNITAGSFNALTQGDRQIVIQNPNFEGSSAIPPPGWLTVNGASNSEISYETVTPAPNKLQSIKLTTTAAGHGIVTQTHFSVMVNEPYSITFMAKSDGVGEIAGNLVWVDKNGTFVNQVVAGGNSTTTSWTQFTNYGAVPSGAIAVEIVLQNNAPVTSSVWFDQISVQKLNFPAGIRAQSFDVFPTHGDRHFWTPNSNFEGSTLLPPPGWNGNSDNTYAYDTSTPAPGKSQSIAITTHTASASMRSLSLAGVVPGDTYEFSCMSKSDGVGQAGCGITCHTAAGAQTGLGLAGSLNQTTTWTFESGTFQIPANTENCNVILENVAATQPSTVEFDQIYVQKLNFLSSPIAPGLTTPGLDLVLSETGDQFGAMRAHIRNRTGSNGLFLENPVQVLADVAFASTAIITNIAIDGANNLTVTAAFGSGGGGLPSVGQTVALSGLTTATFLNGQTVNIATISASQFTASFTHAAYTSAADTGTATIQINARGEFRAAQIAPANTTGEFQVIDPTSALVHWIAAGKAQAAFSGSAVVTGPSPWIDVMAPTYGAKCDGVTDDTTAINNALAAAGTVPGGLVLIPNGKTCVFTSTLTYAGKTGIGLVSNRTNAGLAVTGGVPTGVPILLYTGTATPGINMSGAQELLEGITVVYNNAAFTGTLVSMDAGVQSANNVLHSVTLSGTGTAKNATQLLSMDNTINSKLDGVIFGNAVHALRVTNTGFSNNNMMINSEITGSISGTYVIHGGSAQAWSFLNNDIELANVTAAQNIFDFSASGCGGCTFSGNWVGDAPAAWAGSFWKQGAVNGGLNISGNYINGGSSILATFMTLGNSIAGLSITGNEIGAFGTTIALGTGDQAIFVQGNFFSNGGSFATTGTPAWAVFDVAGVVTFIGNGVQFPAKAFASLPASLNGTQIYCTDCNATCTAGASTGQMCFRVNGAWTH